MLSETFPDSQNDLPVSSAHSLQHIALFFICIRNNLVSLRIFLLSVHCLLLYQHAQNSGWLVELLSAYLLYDCLRQSLAGWEEVLPRWILHRLLLWEIAADQWAEEFRHDGWEEKPSDGLRRSPGGASCNEVQ